MLVGIGVIGTLTSSITTYFIREDSKNANKKDDQLEKIIQKLNDIEKQNQELKTEIQELKQKADKK